MKHKEPVAREGWPLIMISAIITIGLYFLSYPIIALIGLIMTAFCIFFFRNPERTIPIDEAVMVAPADGRIMDIMNINEDRYMHTNTIRIRIFLSLFNVHVNRAPIEGQTEWVQRVAGVFLPAYKDEASHRNARNYVGIDTKWGKILMVQITGIVARRLVCWVQPGVKLQIGQRFGLICFGSCTEIYLPADALVLVAPGQKVRGGETPIARLNK